MNKLYARGIAGQLFYNSTEVIAYALTYRPVPDELIYTKRIRYGKEKLEYINTFSPKKYHNAKKPLFIYIHGGGWISGLTDMRNSYVAQWAKKGFFAASISYSYAPQKVFPFQLQEIFNAIDFIADHADEYNIDLSNIVIAGESAGGYYISYVASCINDNSSIEKLGLTFRHKDDIKIKAVVSHCGCYDLKRLTNSDKKQSKFPDIKMMTTSFVGMDIKTLCNKLNSSDGYLYSPQIKEGFPPTFVTWGDKDLLRYEAFDFIEELKNNNIEYRVFKSDGIIGMHAWSIVPLFKKSRICLSETFDFVFPYTNNYFSKNSVGEWIFTKN